jgi:hypothetical protein
LKKNSIHIHAVPVVQQLLQDKPFLNKFVKLHAISISQGIDFRWAKEKKQNRDKYYCNTLAVDAQRRMPWMGINSYEEHPASYPSTLLYF